MPSILSSPKKSPASKKQKPTDLKKKNTFLFAVDAKKSLAAIKKKYPDAHCELNHENPFQLLIATILSAQCTDERVNKVTSVLFTELPTPELLSTAPIEKIESIIQSTGFYKNKAKNIKDCALSLVKNHNSQVPRTVDELTALSGVGRKTANVVLGVAFGIPNGVVVDTHVKRLSQRIGFSKNSDPEKVEHDLCNLFDKKEWIMLSHYLIFHGRRFCKARNPDCEKCFMNDLCPKNLAK